MKTEFALAFLIAIIAMHSAELRADESDAGASWKAGTARADITPQEPLWLAGYAARNRPAEGTLHSLWVKALALEDASGNRALLITSDILGFPKDMAERVCGRIQARHKLTRDSIILSASHTHSAPVIGNSLHCMYLYDAAEAEKLARYATWLEDQLAALADATLADLQPATVFAGNGVARFAVNRRNNVEADLTPTSVIAGPYDHAVPTLKVVRADGTTPAILFGYACHATVLSDYEWNGDYPGFAQAALEAAYPGTVALFFAGCGADQNALPRRSVALAQQYGRTLAAAVMRVLDEPMSALAPRLAVAYEETTLELEPAPGADALRERAANTGGYEKSCTQWLLDKLEAGEALPESYPYPVHLWRIGGQTLIALGGEVTSAYAIGIKEKLGQDTFVMGYANDLMAYIPSERILEEGGYEGKSSQLIYGMPNVWKPGLEKCILDTVAKLYAQTAGQ